MNEKIAQLQEKVKQYWGQMGRKTKLWLAASLVGLLTTAILLIVVFTRTEYQVAFQHLDTADAASVIGYLDGAGIPYKIEDGGQTISVPSVRASKVKIDVGSQGLVKNGSIGFDFFNSSSTLGTTDNVFNVQYLNAYNGAIERLLRSMQGVQDATVLITMPKRSVFVVPDEEQATASALVTFKTGYTPTQQQIDGMYNLIKTAVPKMSIDNITITSPEQELPHSSVSGGSLGSVDEVQSQFQIRRQYEAELKRSVQQYLGQIFGTDNVVVFVTSSLNFDKKTTEEQLVKPLDNNNNNGIVISQQAVSSSSTGSNGQDGGIVGTGSTDIPGYESVNSSNDSSSEYNSQITNYEVSRIQNSIVGAPYQVTDLSISVAVEQSLLPDEANREVVLDTLKSLVRAQLRDSGQDIDNDALIDKKVSLISQTFADRSQNLLGNGISTPWVIGLGALALLLGAGVVFLFVRNKRKKQEVETMVEEEENILPTQVEYPSLDFEQVQGESQARKNLETLAKRKPDEFVNLLRTWLADE